MKYLKIPRAVVHVLDFRRNPITFVLVVIIVLVEVFVRQTGTREQLIELFALMPGKPWTYAT